MADAQPKVKIVASRYLSKTKPTSSSSSSSSSSEGAQASRSSGGSSSANSRTKRPTAGKSTVAAPLAAPPSSSEWTSTKENDDPSAGSHRLTISSTSSSKTRAAHAIPRRGKAKAPSATKVLLETTAVGSKTTTSSSSSSTSRLTLPTKVRSLGVPSSSFSTTASSSSSSSSSSDATKKASSRSAKLEKRLQILNHDMDMLYSVHLQWLLINIRAEQATARQKAEAEKQLYVATQELNKLRKEVMLEQALLESEQYNTYLEEVVSAQYSCIPILEESIKKIPDYQELAAAVEISTHCIPVTGVIVPTQGEFLQALESAAATLGEIREAVGPRIDELHGYAEAMEGLTVMLKEELRELKRCKELLVQASMIESQRRSLLIQHIQENRCRWA